jgi:hypothetical protein
LSIQNACTLWGTLTSRKLSVFTLQHCA